MRTLREDGWDKVVQGITTVEEILRVTLSDRN
jgi:type II secretory ATPase GspE/PulE/Tfp pilus assembly ATPase PilB-like protein